MRKFILVAFVATACTPASEHSTSTGTEESTTRGPASDTGASTSSVADTSTGAIAGYHPEGFAAAEVHGPELKLHTQDCRACHGNDLKGGSAEVSCDSCHEPEWRTDCVYCHGGSENATTSR